MHVSARRMRKPAPNACSSGHIYSHMHAHADSRSNPGPPLLAHEPARVMTWPLHQLPRTRAPWCLRHPLPAASMPASPNAPAHLLGVHEGAPDLVQVLVEARVARVEDVLLHLRRTHRPRKRGGGRDQHSATRRPRRLRSATWSARVGRDHDAHERRPAFRLQGKSLIQQQPRPVGPSRPPEPHSSPHNPRA